MEYVLTAVVYLSAFAAALFFQGFTVIPLWAVGALILAWAASQWKGRILSFAAVGLFFLTTLKLFLTNGAFQFAPLGSFLFMLNTRALAYLVLAGALGASAALFRRLDDRDSILFRKAFHYGWCIILFLLLTVETSDYFLHLVARVPGEMREMLGLYRRMFLAAIWMVYSMPLLWYGLRKQLPPLFLSGIALVTIAVGLGGTWGMVYSPIERFTPFTNVRAAVLAFLVLGVILHTQWLTGVRRRYHRLEALMHFTWALLLFELFTVETNDYFRRLIEFASAAEKPSLSFARLLTLSAVWMVLSLPLIRLGLARKMRPILYLGIWSLFLAIGMAAIRGIAFEPMEKFAPLVNYRAFVLALVIVGSLVNARWIRYSGQLFGFLYEMLNALRIGIALLVLVLLTGEIRDAFEHAASLAYQQGPSGDVTERIMALESMKQFALSGAWLVTAAVLMVIGFMRKVLNLRVLALVLCAVVAVKVLIFDLGPFVMPVRVAGYVALAAVAFGGYRLFRRHRAALLDGSTFMDEQKGSDQIIV